MNAEAKTTDKEKKQKVLLGVIVVLFTVVGIWNLVLNPALEEQTRIEDRIQAARDVKREQERLLNRADEIEKEYVELHERLDTLARNQLPPGANPVAWCGERVGRAARRAEISEKNRSYSAANTAAQRRGGGRKRKDELPPFFHPYGVAVELTAGYHQLGRFLAELERDMQFMRLKAMSVESNPNELEGPLGITVTCFFPQFTADGVPPGSRPGSPKPTAPSYAMESRK